MQVTPDTPTTPPDMKAHGGKRRGAGRPPGRKNSKTIARELSVDTAVADVLKRLTGDEIEHLSATAVMHIAMVTLVKAGNLVGAVAVAKELAPYTTPKMSSILPIPVLPADLEPDEPCQPDEPGPTNPVMA